MTLTTRLSGFFLAALAAVLVGFDVTLYVLAGNYLLKERDEQLQDALGLLEAAAEFQLDGIDWEPQERVISLGNDAGPDQIRWTVHDDAGHLVDHSHNLPEKDLWTDLSQQRTTVEPLVSQRGGERWTFRQQVLKPSDNRKDRGTIPEPDVGFRHKTLLLTVGLSLQTTDAILRNLAITLVGISAALWLVAAGLGRLLCRRALLPLRRMAGAARQFGAADLGRRLPSPNTHDELEDLGAAFNDLLRRLQDSFERQRRFTGDASHQLRTPLTVILGQIEVSLRRERSADDYCQVLRTVRDQAERLRRLVEMLLFLARADAEAGLPALETLDLRVWLEEFLKEHADHPRAADFRLEHEGAVINVTGHGPLLAQLVDNLLENACKYSAPGTPIILRSAMSDGVAFLEVEDRGCGVDPDDLPHLFEPFFRSKKARLGDTEGVGLGLAVAQRIARALRGTLKVRSTPGDGSVFRLELPSAQTAPSAIPIPPSFN